MPNIAIDVHVHLVPVLHDRIHQLDGVEWADDKLWVDGHPIGIKAIYQVGELIAWMDAHEIDRAMVSAPPPLYRSHLGLEETTIWTQYINDGLREQCSYRSDRLLPAIHVPIHHIELANEVVGRETQNRRSHFSVGAGGINGGVFSDPALEPMWKALDTASAFLFVHPAACGDGRLSEFYLENLLGNPYETSVAAAHMIFSAVPSRYPKVRICLAHGGGGTAMVIGRWQRGFDQNRPGIDKALEGPRDAAKRFLADCIVHDREALELAASIFGREHILFGSDWPFPMGIMDPNDQLAEVEPTLLDAIFNGNSDGIFGQLPLTKPNPV